MTFDTPVAVYAVPVGLVQTTAVSGVARRIQESVARLWSNEQAHSLSGREVEFEARLHAALDELVPDEDQHAVPVEAVRVVSRLVRALPASLPLPEVAIDPDGAISLDWLPSRTRMFSVSADNSGRLAYAWMDGSDRGHAVARFEGSIPAPLLTQLLALIDDHKTVVRAA